MWFYPVWIGFAVVTALAAAARNRNPVAWGVIGLAGGVFALLAVLVMRPGEEVADAGESWSPPAKPSAATGAQIATHKGIAIFQEESGYWALGQSFDTIEAARAYIDRFRV